MKKKKILAIISAIGTIAGLATVLFEAKTNFEHSDRFREDMKLFDKGSTLRDEYYAVENAYYSENMTKIQYISKLKELVPQFNEYLDEMDSHLWVEDAILDRKMTADILELMKEEIHDWETRVRNQVT